MIYRLILVTLIWTVWTTYAWADMPPPESEAGHHRVRPKPDDDTKLKTPTFCTEQYAPVCAKLDGTPKTYSNSCFARADGAAIIGQGPCTNDHPQQPTQPR